jgi:hypothetical protein
MKKEKLTKEQKKQLLSIINGRIYLLKGELKRLNDLLLKDLESVKKWIKNQ